MTWSLPTIKARIAAAVEDVTATVDSETFTINCFGYTPDRVSPPTFYAGEVELAWSDDRRVTFSQSPATQVTCLLLVSRSDDRAGQRLLDEFLSYPGSGSVKAAIEADPTLGGACSAAHVHHVDGYRLYRVGDTEYFGARFRVLVVP